MAAANRMRGLGYRGLTLRLRNEEAETPHCDLGTRRLVQQLAPHCVHKQGCSNGWRGNQVCFRALGGGHSRRRRFIAQGHILSDKEAAT